MGTRGAEVEIECLLEKIGRIIIPPGITFKQTVVHGPMPSIGKASAVFKGTAFEQRSLRVLQSQLSMSLRRVGGASDGGVDLLGWWYLPYFMSQTSPPQSIHSDSNESAIHSTRIRVIAQCKAYTKKLPPSTVREMEGVLYQYSRTGVSRLSDTTNSDTMEGELHPGPNVALLISQSPFTRQTVLRAMSSTVPFLLLHLPPETHTSEATLIDGTLIEEDESAIGSALWNQALGGSSGILRGQFELRWQHHRALSGSRNEYESPSLWWKGKPIPDLAPRTVTI